jgi:hypothetical protein
LAFYIKGNGCNLITAKTKIFDWLILERSFTIVKKILAGNEPSRENKLITLKERVN